MYHDVNWLKSAYESVERDIEIQQKGADFELFSSLKGMDLTELFMQRYSESREVTPDISRDFIMF